jgi:AraC-like DNA-binding protein
VGYPALPTQWCRFNGETDPTRRGETPTDYLARWRMLLAGDRLTTSSDPVSIIAQSLRDESESAFSTAFNRVMGCSRRQYSRQPNLSSPINNEDDSPRASKLEAIAG